MKFIKNYRSTIITITIIGLCVLLLTKCVNNDSDKSITADKTELEQFAGSESCAGCHKNIYDSHIKTAHYLTTRPAEQKYIKGNFENGKNRYAYDSGRVVVMEKRDSGFYQVGYFEGSERIARRFDIVVGSGSKGQTYITREHDQLYQMPVSYFTAADKWANSPLYPTYPVIFNRTITSRCMECHSTYVRILSTPDVDPEAFDTRIIYGVDCEKCHGPAARHVAFQTENPKETKAKFILNPAHFSKQQNLDLCGLCHGGRLQKTKPSFEYISGDRLEDYFKIDTATPNPDNIDVHGNQYGLLRSSRCFKESNAMTCVTCHNPHENERGNIALFSQRCISCHNPEHNNSCKMTASIGPSISLNCIDCHMPLKPSRSITELLPGDRKPTAAMIRSHLIKIYRDITVNSGTGSQKIN